MLLAAGTRTTARQRRQRVFVVASVSKLSPQRLQVMVVTAPIIAPMLSDRVASLLTSSGYVGKARQPGQRGAPEPSLRAPPYRGRVVRTPTQMSSYIPWPSYGWFGLALISKLIVRSAALKVVWPTGRSGALPTALHLLLRAVFLQSSRDLS
jgi:hypothetical protein